MNSSEIKTHIQGLFGNGLVTIIGSGLSVAQGLPSTDALGAHLLTAMPGTVPADDWKPYAEKLQNGIDLESAFNDLDEDSPLLEAVTAEVARCVASAEQTALEALHGTLHELPFARLVPHLPTDKGAVVITTNYDRLLEIGAEAAGCVVDTLFDGAYHGRLDPQASREAYRTILNGKRLRVATRKHVQILKPHGSLDWRRGTVEPFRSLLSLGGSPLVITPGGSKYRRGYEAPFEQHRAAANQAIREAQSFLIVGFGFNDDHLQHELHSRLKAGAPALVATRALTANAQKVLADADSAVGLERLADDATRAYYGTNETTDLPASQMWDLGLMIKEALT
jgi:hypothetical protein